jgi:high-affinity Fe2+/Pb2+ permease
VIPPDSKTTFLRPQRHVRLKNRRELIAAVIVGLTLAAIVGYLIYVLAVKHPVSN